MKNVYLDNAATTALRPEVIDEMARVLRDEFGNPSSTHSFGRSARSTVELSRKQIAALVGAAASEIIFTSCGTESNNWILRRAIVDLKVERFISSRIEHHAVLHTLEVLKDEFGISVDFVALDGCGNVDLEDLKRLLGEGTATLVSLMHVNNEIGTVLDLKATAAICKEHHAFFHTDAVQSIGKTEFDLKELGVDFMSASAHKFNGPKGIGFAYVRKGIVLHPMIYGGEQEKGLRAGTESVHNIAGMAKALELAYAHLGHDREHIAGLKRYLLSQLDEKFAGYACNGGQTFYNIANILLPFDEAKTAMILFHLDIKGIAVSRGSACQSGSISPSHVLAQILTGDDLRKPSLRISMGHENTKDDIDALIDALRAV